MNRSMVLAETADFRLELEINDTQAILRPKGLINEDVDFVKVLEVLVETGSVVKSLNFDMGKVTQINSCGIRAWILFLERLQSSKISCAFLMASESFIEQASIVPNLLGKVGTPVLEFEAPFFCSKCNTRKLKALKTDQISYKDDNYVYPIVHCDKCKIAMSFDALEEEYLSFLKKFKKPVSRPA